jgi:hypothetical protein
LFYEGKTGQTLLPTTVPVVGKHRVEKKSDETLEPFEYYSRLAYCFFGLQLCYLTWGVLQEKMMTQNYEKLNFLRIFL